MASIDELFKKPTVPSKRKFEAPTHDPSAFYKSSKKISNGESRRSNERSATVEDEAPGGEDDDDVAGPALPPSEDDDEGIADEEGERFFGGGIGEDTMEVLDFMDQQDAEGDAAPEIIDSTWLRKLALNFERKISKNSELRAKFEDQPEKYVRLPTPTQQLPILLLRLGDDSDLTLYRFMRSEADLDADIKAISILSEHSELYEEFASLGCVASLVSLLAHENTDIAIDAIEVIDELTDEDVEAEESQWSSIVEAMIEADLLSLLASNLSRLDEAIESDRNGVYHILAVLENLSSNPSTAAKIGAVTTLLTWLFSRIQASESSPVSQNKQYAAEVLAILLQSSPQSATKFLTLPTNDSSASSPIDLILQILSRYRRHDPAPSTDEEEYVENLFDALTCLVDTNLGKAHFVAAEGIELCVILLKESKFARNRAARVLDHALSANFSSDPNEPSTSSSASVPRNNQHREEELLSPPDLASQSCTRLVIDAAGLGVIFKAFMRATAPPKKSSTSSSSSDAKQKQERDSRAFLEHLLGIFASLLRWLPGGGQPARIRTLAKFVEGDYEKIERLVGVRGEVVGRVERVEREIERERKEVEREERGGGAENEEERAVRESEWLGRRLDAGLFVLQTVEVILAWCVAEDEGAKKRAGELLSGDGGFEVLKRSLKGQLEEMDGDAGGAREMIEALLDCL
ncbi:MAG: hypothetical protein Q9227_000334 [Pyrenula ochraceoflavens]